MKYQDAIDYVLGFTDYEKVPGFAYSAANFDLRRMELLLERLGNPHLGVRSIHIAGTKGKGSVAAMIAAALQAAGYSTGLFTSPHLHTIRERIAIDGQLIAEEELATLVERLKPEVEALNRRSTYGQLTTFEILTALTFLHFHERGVDFQVLEAGLGGRLDATNVVSPEVCLITSISLDHVEVLGTTIAQIAAEKAGIIKPGSTVVTSPQPAEAAEVITKTCLENGTRLIRVGEDVTWHQIAADLDGQSFLMNGQIDRYELTIPLLGDHQLENAAAAVAALEMVSIPKKSIASGLAGVRWPGRLEILSHEPMIVVDGAHNADSARRLREAIKRYFHCDRMTLIIGTAVDKDLEGIVRELSPLADKVILTRSRHPRAIEPSILAGEFARHGLRPQIAPDVSKAMSEALADAGKGDLICATGSLFIVAEVSAYVRSMSSQLLLSRS